MQGQDLKGSQQAGSKAPETCVSGLADAGRGCGDSRSVGWQGAVPSYI